MSMISVFFKPLHCLAPKNTALFATFFVAMMGLLTACSGAANRPQPAELAANVALIGVKQAWVNRVGAVPAGSVPAVSGNTLVVAAVDGTMAAINATTGQDLWRASAGVSLATGAGTDGKRAAAVSRDNELLAFEGGKQLWKAKLPAQVFTAPLVAGERVFVLVADRSVHAFDGATGQKLWVQQRPSEALVLRQPGILLAVGDTLLAGLGGRLTGLNPNNGSVRWEAPIASPRSTNDIERLVDLVGGTSRDGEVVCARAFQASVGCVNAARGTVLWSRAASGQQGVTGDGRLLFGTESDGKLIAWRASDGQPAWQTDRLLYRTLSAPLVVGRSVVVGDGTGFLHMLSREDGSPLNRLSTDGSAITAQPVLAGESLIALTLSGGVFGFRPE
jgi:outer membrane protein assembly factor BamB